MLTKDLVRFQIRKQKIYPQFIDPSDDVLLGTAASLLDVIECALGEFRGSIDETLKEIIQSSPAEALISRGLEKLIQDRCVYETPEDEERPQFRAEVFSQIGDLLKNDMPDEEMAFEARVQQMFGKDREQLAHQLYSDLPEFHPLIKFKSINAKDLLHRYNCAQIQWLLLHANALEITIEDVSPGHMRQLFKYLRFNRLLANLKRDGKTYHLKVEGPLNIFYQTKKYGLNLANFFPALLHQEKWSLTCEIRINEKRKGQLTLDQDCGLTAPPERFHGYIPKEYQVFEKSFKKKEPNWKIDATPNFLNLGGELICFPDFSLSHKKNKQKAAIEFFHAWHASHLTTRLQQLRNEPKTPLLIGVDLKCAKDPLVEKLLKDSPWFQDYGFTFRDIPTLSKVQSILKKLDASSESDLG